MNIAFTVVAFLTAATGNTVAVAAEDTAITAQIEGLFAVNPYLSPFNINTTTLDGVTTLTGGVRETAQRQLAEDLARSVRGVKNVHNNLMVVPTATGGKERRGWRQKTRDTALIAAVRARLLTKGRFQGVHIGVECVNEAVTLYGVVHDEALKNEIGAVAAETQGVKSVLNHLTVRPRTPNDPIAGIGRQFSDEWLEGRVETAILLNHYLSIRELDIEVDDGICILTGLVDSEQERTLAGALAGSIQGVNTVRNEIQIRRAPVRLEGSEPTEEPTSEPPASLEEKPLSAPE